MDRQAAWDLLCEYTKGEGLRKHGLAVEAVMRHFARKHGEDEETWGIVGLLHDFDYEQHPDAAQHPSEGAPILRERGYPEEVVRGRMAKAADEMSHWPEYDYIVVNEDVAQGVAEVTSILQAERLRRERRVGLHDFVEILRKGR